MAQVKDSVLLGSFPLNWQGSNNSFSINLLEQLTALRNISLTRLTVCYKRIYNSEQADERDA